jgi:tetratricopeptide (TPR) repeat protein
VTHRFATALPALAVLLGGTTAYAERTWEQGVAEGRSLCAKGRFGLAAKVLRDALDIATARGAPDRDVAEIEQLLGIAALGLGDLDGAEAHLHEATSVLGRTARRDDPLLLRWLLDLATVQARKRDLDAAEATFCRVLRTGGKDPILQSNCLQGLGNVAVRRHAYALAMRLLEHAASCLAQAPQADRLGALTEVSLAIVWLTMETGNLEAAAALLMQMRPHLAGRVDPQAVRAAGLHVEVLRRQGTAEDALRFAQTVRVGDPPGPEMASLVAAIAEAHLDRGDAASAQVAVDRLGAVVPVTDAQKGAWARISCARARLAMTRAEWESARATLEGVLAEREEAGGGLDLARTWLLLARVERGERRHVRAVECAQRAAAIFLHELGPGSEEGERCLREVEALRREALDARIDEVSLPPRLVGRRLGDRVEAGWEQTDGKVRAAVERARLALDAGHCERAIEELASAEALRPDEASLHYYRALALEQSGSPDDALTAMGKALALRRDEPMLYTAHAGLCFTAGRFDRMLVDTTYARLLGRAEADCLYLRGLANHGLGDLEASLADFARVKEAAPSNVRAWLWSGKVLAALGRIDDAERDLLRAAGAEEHEAEARLELASLYRRSGRTERAIAESSLVLERNPTEARALWIRAVSSFDAGAWERALGDLGRLDDQASLRTDLYRWLCLRYTKGPAVADAALAESIDRATESDALRGIAGALHRGDGAAIESALSTLKGELLCQACFFVGAWRESSGDAAGAIAAFDRAASQNAGTVDEHHGAVAARGRLARRTEHGR